MQVVDTDAYETNGLLLKPPFVFLYMGRSIFISKLFTIPLFNSPIVIFANFHDPEPFLSPKGPF